MTKTLERAIRDTRLMERMFPAEAIRHEQASRQAIDVTGVLHAHAMKPYMIPLHYRFFLPGATENGQTAGMDRVPRAGTLTRIDAYAATPPTSRCVVEIRDETAKTLGTVTITPEESTGESAGLTVELRAGQWVGALVIEHGGAANVSIVATQQVR